MRRFVGEHASSVPGVTYVLRQVCSLLRVSLSDPLLWMMGVFGGRNVRSRIAFGSTRASHK